MSDDNEKTGEFALLSGVSTRLEIHPSEALKNLADAVTALGHHSPTHEMLGSAATAIAISAVYLATQLRPEGWVEDPKLRALRARVSKVVDSLESNMSEFAETTRAVADAVVQDLRAALG